jgi:arylsulfatase A-like enzyme
VDLVPTLLALLGVPDDGSEFDGHPLFQVGAEGVVPETSERPQIAELLIPRRQIVRSVLEGDWKYVATWRRLDPSERATAHDRPPDPDLDFWGPPVHEELFHLGTDPGERRNLIAEEARARRELTAALARFRDAGPNHGFTAAAASAPGALELSPEDAERLEALGYRE